MTQVCRNAIKPMLGNFSQLKQQDVHAGLILTKGMIDLSENSKSSDNKAGENKANRIREISELSPSSLYQAAFKRWQSATKDEARFQQVEAKLEGRLYIGVTRDNALETGVTVSHTYGMPMIPGSAIKGLCRACAGEWLNNKEACSYLFGNEWGEADQDKMESGGLIFHDAWWMPEGKPFVPEVITVHHQEYYGSEGEKEATDLDSPIPAPQIAVRGSFYFVIEGEPAWAKLAKRLLARALNEYGIGAKTSSGYGYFENV